MHTVKTHYPRIVMLLEAMRADNGEIFLDQIEGALLSLSLDELEIIAAGEQTEQQEVMARLSHHSAKALEVILNAAFDGV